MWWIIIGVVVVLLIWFGYKDDQKIVDKVTKRKMEEFKKNKERNTVDDSDD